MSFAYKHIVLLFLLCLFASCRTEIVYKGEITEPQMVVFCRVEPTRWPPQCTVQRSWFFLDDSKQYKQEPVLKQYVLPDAKVEYRVNDSAWLELPYNESSCYYRYKYEDDDKVYRGPRYPQVGDVITVKVNHPQYGETTAKQTIPEKPRIDLVDVELTSKNATTDNDYLVYKLTYHICPTEDRTLVGRLEVQDSWLRTLAVLSSDILFQELNSPDQQDWEEMIENMFSFEIEEVETYEYLDFRMSDLPEEGKDVIVLAYAPHSYINNEKTAQLDGITTQVRTYTSDTYLYMQSMAKFAGSNESMLGMEEKVQVFGNFSGNVIGCFTVFSQYRYMTMFQYEEK